MWVSFVQPRLQSDRNIWLKICALKNKESCVCWGDLTLLERKTDKTTEFQRVDLGRWINKWPLRKNRGLRKATSARNGPVWLETSEEMMNSVSGAGTIGRPHGKVHRISPLPHNTHTYTIPNGLTV